jgi:hypothetical protein
MVARSREETPMSINIAVRIRRCLDRPTLVVTAMLAALAVSPLAAGAQSVSPTVVIDARGSAQKRATFRTQAVVKVRIENKNPYVYRYRTTIDEAIVQETAQQLFAAQLSPLLLAVATAAGGPGPSNAAVPTPESMVPSRTGLKTAETCAAADFAKAAAALKWIDDQRDQVAKFERQALVATRTLAQSYSSVRDQIEARRLALRARHATTAEIDGAASKIKQLEQLYPKPVDVDGVDSRLRDTATAANILKRAIEQFREDFPFCQPVLAGGNPLIADLVYLDSLLGWWLEDKRAVVVAARSGREALNALTTTIARVGAEGSHEELHELGNYANPTSVTVTVRRWSVEDSDEKNIEVVSVAKLEFGGGARFMLSGGLGYVKGIAINEFQATRGFERKPTGEAVSEVLGPVVGLKRSETKMVTPALLLNTRLIRLPDNPLTQSVFWTIGVTAKKDTGIDVDYLIGLSAGTLNDHVVITGGWYFGKEETLSGDLYPGAKIPDDMTAIPVKKSYGKAAAVFVTYKIK